MDRDYDGPGGMRIRRMPEGCRSPSEKAAEAARKWRQVDDCAARLAIEQRHDPGVVMATYSRADVIDEYAAAAAGRCSCCGDLIGEVEVCPICKTQQAVTGQRKQRRMMA